MKAVIDTNARQKLAEALRALVSGVITNDEFEERIPLGSEDPAINAIFSAGWSLYSDLWSYRLRDHHRLPRATKSEVARWILFLKTETPYEWPVLKGISDFFLILSSLLTLGLTMMIYRKSYRQQGDYDVWPFIRSSDYQAALCTPAYLDGVSDARSSC